MRDAARAVAWSIVDDPQAASGLQCGIDAALASVLSRQAHPGRGRCDCGTLEAVDYWFQFTPEGGVETRAGALPAVMVEAIAALMTGARTGTMEGEVHIRRVDAATEQFAAFRWEPHIGVSGGQIGLVARPGALAPILERTYRRATMLPKVLSDGRDAHRFVDLHIADAAGATVFSSPETVQGPQEIHTDLFPDRPRWLQLHASMTPAFVATLGPDHGGGPSTTLTIGLVIVNALMVTVGLWQLARERELTRLRTDFVAGVSHELRTPLAQIRMFTDTLLLGRIRNPGEGRRALEIIARETRRLGQLVENVLQRLAQLSETDGIDVDGIHPSLRTDCLGQTRGEIAATRAEVCDVTAWRDIQLPEDILHPLPLLARDLDVAFLGGYRGQAEQPRRDGDELTRTKRMIHDGLLWRTGRAYGRSVITREPSAAKVGER